MFNKFIEQLLLLNSFKTANINSIECHLLYHDGSGYAKADTLLTSSSNLNSNGRYSFFGIYSKDAYEKKIKDWKERNASYLKNLSEETLKKHEEQQRKELLFSFNVLQAPNNCGIRILTNFHKASPLMRGVKLLDSLLPELNYHLERTSGMSILTLADSIGRKTTLFSTLEKHGWKEIGSAFNVNSSNNVYVYCRVFRDPKDPDSARSFDDDDDED